MNEAESGDGDGGAEGAVVGEVEARVELVEGLKEDDPPVPHPHRNDLAGATASSDDKKGVARPPSSSALELGLAGIDSALTPSVEGGEVDDGKGERGAGPSVASSSIQLGVAADDDAPPLPLSVRSARRHVRMTGRRLDALAIERQDAGALPALPLVESRGGVKNQVNLYVRKSGVWREVAVLKNPVETGYWYGMRVALDGNVLLATSTNNVFLYDVEECAKMAKTPTFDP
ncbi:hypothetical protein ACHAWF_009753 [Thalassiosira exigua]